MRSRALGLAFLLGLAACNQSPGPLYKDDRVAKAEAAMAECKKRVGLDEVATPYGMVVEDHATRGQEMRQKLADKVWHTVELAEVWSEHSDDGSAKKCKQAV